MTDENYFLRGGSFIDDIAHVSLMFERPYFKWNIILGSRVNVLLFSFNLTLTYMMKVIHYLPNGKSELMERHVPIEKKCLSNKRITQTVDALKGLTFLVEPNNLTMGKESYREKPILTVNGTGKNMGDDDTGNMLKFWKLNQQSNNNKCTLSSVGFGYTCPRYTNVEKHWVQDRVRAIISKQADGGQGMLLWDLYCAF
ncbi:hypothetical protein ACJX0J_028938, partial [Zea mays]